MAFSDGNPEKLAEIARKGQQALDNDDPVAMHATVKDLAAEIGVDGLVEVWKSGS